MAGTTPNLGLYLPGGGSTGTWAPDEVADVDPINQNFQKVDQFAGQVGVQANQNRQFYGPAAAISSVIGQKLGDQYQESDSEKRIWYYDGANWTSRENGCAFIRPSTTTPPTGTGVTVVNGVVVLTNVPASTISLPNIFSDKYDRYLVDITIDTAVGDAGMGFQMRTAAGPIVLYYGSYFEMAIGLGPTRADTNGGTSFGAGRYAIAGGNAQVEVIRPAKPTGGSKQFLVKSVDGAAYTRFGGGYCPVAVGTNITGIDLIVPVQINAGRIKIFGFGAY